MLVNRSVQILGQLTNRVTSTPTYIRSNQHLRTQFHLKPQRQQQQKLQQNYSRNYHNRAIPSSSSSYAVVTTPPTIKSHLNKNCIKGRVCVVLLPVLSVSCAATQSISTSTAASASSSSSKGNSKSNNSSIDTSDQDDDMGSEEYKNAKSIYEFTVKDTHGNDVSLENYKGHVVLIVNIASKCGLTKNNYKKLTDLKEKYHDKGLRILNFPCNQFGSQMPEEDGEPMVCHLRDAKADIGEVFQKVDVNGSGTAPLYQYLKAKQGGILGSAIKWNFTKFLINKEGIPVERYAPTTDPMDIAKDIEKLL